MIKINLLPEEEKVKRREFRLPEMSTVYLVAAIAIFCAAIIGVSFMQQHKVRSLEGKIAAAQEESRKLAPQLAKIKQITKEREEVDRRLNIIANLDMNRYYRVKLLNDISFNLPVNCWLTDITENSPNNFDIGGIAFSNYTVADMITNLQGSPLFTLVDLRIAEKGKINEREVMKFKLTANAMPQ
jgi:type IV pilus assembly protein PilN